MLRVLLVAPRTDLKLADEEAQDILRSGLDVTPLIGEVTSRELLREVKANNYDVLWLATHGEKRVGLANKTEFGIVLSDGILPAAELVAQVRGRFSLVYLNTCTSFRLAQQIQEEANVTVVGTLVDVEDRLAYQTGALFATALASGATPAQAYKRSKPGGERIYMFLAALEPAYDSLESLVTEIRNLQEQLVKSNKRLWWLVAGIGAALGISILNTLWLMFY